MRWKKKQIKQEFIKLYEAPEPPGKQEFLKQFDTCYLSMGQFMWQQLLYIKKWMWLFSAGIFFLGTMLGRNLDRETVWVISALIPFLALTFLMESGRSKIYGMEELEYATRFSLKSLMLARLGVLGLFHGVILLLLFLCIPQGFFPGPKDLMYVLVPYFLTVSLGLSLLRRFRGREVLYISLGVPAFVSLFVAVANQKYPLYSISMVKWWGIACLLVMIFTVKETILFFRQTEELLWS